MSRKKLPKDKKKPKISITIDEKLDSVMEKHLDNVGINRSKYIENLIREDIKSKGYDVEPDF